MMLFSCHLVSVAKPTFVNVPLLLKQPHYLTEKEALSLIRECYDKANFFSVLEHHPKPSGNINTNEDEQSTWMEGHYAKIDLRDPGRYTLNKSRLYTLNVVLIKDDPSSPASALQFKISTENEGMAGKKYAEVVLKNFLDEFTERLQQFDAFLEVHPAEIASDYLDGKNLVTDYGYTTLKIADLTYEEPDTWDNYEKALQFITKKCNTDDIQCQGLINDIYNKESFWTVLEKELETHPEKMNMVAVNLPKDKLDNPMFLRLLSKASSQASGTLGEFEAEQDNIMSLPEEWRKEGVGTEKARALEKDIAFKTFDFLKRSNTFDVDTQENLMIERIANKLFPLALRKGLEYEVHIYDDTRPNIAGTGFNAFTSGGGILYFSRSLVQALDPEDEDAIAAVVAHEMGHNEAYHIQRRILRVETANIIYQLSSIGDAFVPGVSNLTHLVNQIVLQHFSRRDEYEADRMGLYLLYKAGYDPKGMSRTMETLFKESGNRYTALMDSHPAPPARKKRVQHLIDNRNVLELTDYGNLDEEF